MTESDSEKPEAAGEVLAYYNGKTPMYDGHTLAVRPGETLTVGPIRAILVTFTLPKRQ